MMTHDGMTKMDYFVGSRMGEIPAKWNKVNGMYVASRSDGNVMCGVAWYPWKRDDRMKLMILFDRKENRPATEIEATKLRGRNHRFVWRAAR